MYDLTVVCGIIEYKNKILIGKKIEVEHPAGLGGKWHLPGGKVEKNEPLEKALKREVKEETTLEIEIQEQLGYNTHTRKDGKITRIVYYRCISNTDDVRASDDMQELKWVDKQDVLDKLDKHFVEMLPKTVISYFNVP